MAERKVAETHVSSDHSSLEAAPNQLGEKTDTNNLDLDHIGEVQGYVLDEATLRRQLGLSADAKLKTAKDGKTVLIPQPSDDPRDPLNWPTWRKHVTLLVICVAGAMGDWGSASGAIALLPQANEWHLSPNTINHATAGNVFMLGVGGLFVVWWSAYFGRLPVLLFFQCLSLGTAAWCAAASSFNSYMAARVLNGFFSVAAAGGGLMFIKDLYFFHEHPRKINIWSTALILSPFVGPLLTALIVGATSWRWAFWLVTMIDGVALILTILFLDETFYPRHAGAAVPQPKSRWLRLIGVEQRRTHLIPNSFFGAAKRSVVAISKLPVLIATVYYFFTFAWVIGNNITISIFIVPEYHFNYNQLAAIYAAPVLGAALAQVGGHWFHDFIGHMYMRRHGGVIVPEARLIIIWFVTPLYIVGMNLIGSSLSEHWHYMVLAVGWFLHNFATVVLTTGLYAYCLDAYPEGSGEVAAWLNAGRTWGGFVVGYVQINWAVAMGPQKEFGIQSAIVAAVFFMVVFLQFYGAKLRAKQGPMNFKTQ